MKIAKSIGELVGGTPLVRLNRISDDLGLEIIAKLEFFNPANSAKDRIGMAMLEKAEKKGMIKEGIVEPTSGNTGIALAWACAIKGYNLIITMPESASQERVKVMKLLGAEVLLTPADRGMKGAIEKAEELKARGYYMCDQFGNRANAEAHRRTTAMEIWRDTDGLVEGVVAGVGTGGTITGIAEALKEKKNLKAIAVEPAESPVLTAARAGESMEAKAHRLQGIGAGFVPEVFRMDLIDEIIKVSAEESADMMLRLAREEGILAGISSGAAVCGAIKARELFKKGSMVVVILPDMAERYLSTEWLWDQWRI
ncbi:MAG: cysteine synthase A [Candidatus Thermoplasmatota archaeon]|nr:cysteine synthase A [Candidatus Thermoplasmatota archaeon]